jgi:Flp pilus assembly protein CpaB
MTREEILVIAAAAAVFVLINIIMWSIIAKKERKAKANAENDTAPQERNSADRISSVPAAAAAEGFELIENTVIVHTDEKIL